MEFKQFIESVKEEVERRMPEHKVDFNHVLKNNGVELVGLVIRKENEKISPNIYLDNYYRMYSKHQESYSREIISKETIDREVIDKEIIDNIVDSIIDEYNTAISSAFVNRFAFDYSYDNVKDKIFYKVVNYEKNKNMLESVPHRKFLDLAIVYYCLVDNNKEGVASIRITNEHIKRWNISQLDLLELATYNTPILFPGIVRSMMEVVKELFMKNSLISTFEAEDMLCEDSNAYYFNNENRLEESIIDEALSKICNNKYEAYVLTNINAINGASAMLYNGVIEQLANRLKSNICILPSSVHEVILLPYTNDEDIELFKTWVKEINQTKVAKADVLSDSVYIYQRKECAIVM